MQRTYHGISFEVSITFRLVRDQSANITGKWMLFNLGAFVRGLAEYGCLPLRISKIYVPHHIFQTLLYVSVWPYLSYFRLLKISIWQNLDATLGKLVKSGHPLMNEKSEHPVKNLYPPSNVF